MDFYVYLIHISTPIAHMQHYVGYTRDLLERLSRHRSGSGARLLRWANENGVDYHIVRLWRAGHSPGEAYAKEVAIKRQNHSARLCPICNPGDYASHLNEDDVELPREILLDNKNSPRVEIPF